MEDEKTAAQKTWILSRPNAAARDLGLVAGDMLIAINGVPLTGSEHEIKTRIRERRKSALTFMRGKQHRILLADSPYLGIWRHGPDLVKPPVSEGRIHPDAMQNWEIYRASDGCYDLHPAKPTPLLLIAPPLWLSEKRLWSGLAMWIALSLPALAAGLWIGAGLLLILNLYFWHTGQAMLRADRIARGFMPYAVLAGINEKTIHAAVKQMDGKSYYLYAKQTGTAPEDALSVSR